MSVKVGLVSLGCAKNLIDTEVMIGHLAQAGMSLTADIHLRDRRFINVLTGFFEDKRRSLERLR